MDPSGIISELALWACGCVPIGFLTWRSGPALRDWLMVPIHGLLATVAALLAGFALQWLLHWSATRTLYLQFGLVPVTALLVWVRAKQAEQEAAGRYLLRGASILSGFKAAWFLRRRASSAGGATVALAGCPVPLEDETKHFKVIGATGAGKSTAIRELVDRALWRGDRAIIADPGGDYLSRFYREQRGDVIVNPFDRRSVRWDPFAEVTERHEVDQLVRSLIPAEDEWCGYARTFVSAVMQRCMALGKADLETLWHVIAVASSRDVVPFVAGTPAAPFLEEANARLFGSIRAVAVSALAPLDYVRTQNVGLGQVGRFSVRRWVREGKGVLFLPYQAEQIASLSSLIACWMRLGIFQTLALGEAQPAVSPPRLWFVIDELDAVGRIAGLKDALARLRKAGGRCVLGFQSIAQVSGTYGAGEAHTIVENCGNSLILRCSASENGGTSEFASRLIGQREIARRVSTSSWTSSGLLSGSTTQSEGLEHRIEQAVLPSEIEAFPDRMGLLKMASVPSWVAIRFGVYEVPARTPGLVA